MEYNQYFVTEYIDEVLDIEQSYRQAMSYDVSGFAEWLVSQKDQPLLAIGAGGSLPVAEMAARLHYLATGQLGKSGEPIDLFNVNPRANFAGLLVTASGGHSDSLAACARLRHQTDVDWAVFCGKENSKGEQILAGSGTPVFSYELLPDKHGWIAVAALVGQAVVVARAFAAAYPQYFAPLPGNIADLLPLGAVDVKDALAKLTGALTDVLQRERLIFLYGPDTKAAALDLDSKFAESGLGWLSLSEYRNFAHGRYQAVLPEPEKYGVAAFVTPYERDISLATIGELPAEIPGAAIALPELDGAGEQVSSILTLLIVVGALAEVRGARPGWGSRNTFGDVLYEYDLDKYFPIRTTENPNK